MEVDLKQVVLRMIDYVQLLQDRALADKQLYPTGYTLGKISGLIDVDSYLRQVLHEVIKCD